MTRGNENLMITIRVCTDLVLCLISDGIVPPLLQHGFGKHCQLVTVAKVGKGVG